MIIWLITLIFILFGLPALLVVSACVGASRATRAEETVAAHGSHEETLAKFREVRDQLDHYVLE